MSTHGQLLPIGECIGPALDTAFGFWDRGYWRPTSDLAFESRLEADFARETVKYLGDDIRFVSQVPLRTRDRTYRLDFLAKARGRYIAIECDGKEYHDVRKDALRDFAIVRDTRVSAIYRFRGTDLFRNIEDCLYLLRRAEPYFFSERGMANLDSQVTHELRDAVKLGYIDVRTGRSQASVLYFEYPVDNQATLDNVLLVRRTEKRCSATYQSELRL